jgi:hypothetical protein
VRFTYRRPDAPEPDQLIGTERGPPPADLCAHLVEPVIEECLFGLLDGAADGIHPLLCLLPLRLYSLFTVHILSMLEEIEKLSRPGRQHRGLKPIPQLFVQAVDQRLEPMHLPLQSDGAGVGLVRRAERSSWISARSSTLRSAASTKPFP